MLFSTGVREITSKYSAETHKIIGRRDNIIGESVSFYSRYLEISSDKYLISASNKMLSRNNQTT